MGRYRYGCDVFSVCGWRPRAVCGQQVERTDVDVPSYFYVFRRVVPCLELYFSSLGTLARMSVTSLYPRVCVLRCLFWVRVRVLGLTEGGRRRGS